MMSKRILAPSLLSANFSNLKEDIDMINNSSADWIHIDVMDGMFVPNISFGPPVIEHVKKLSKKILDVHLMIEKPERFITQFKKLGTHNLSIHYEASTHLHRSLQMIKDENMKAGVAINPHTPVSVLDDIIQEIDLVIIMSVNPGFGGQNFIENTYKKISDLKDLIIKRKSNSLIEIDGGVNTKNSSKLYSYGADVLVAGNSIFNSKNPLETINDLKKQ